MVHPSAGFSNGQASRGQDKTTGSTYGGRTEDPQGNPRGKDAESTDLQGGKLRRGKLGNNGPASDPPGQAWGLRISCTSQKVGQAGWPEGRKGTEKLSWVMQSLEGHSQKSGLYPEAAEGF